MDARAEDHRDDHMADPPALALERGDDGIATVTLNRPAAFNTLSADCMAELIDTLDHIRDDGTSRVVVLRALGRGFCAGHDLKEMQGHRNDPDRGRAFYETLFKTCHALMQRIRDLPQPVIAEVQGIAVAAGCQLVATCDLAVASDSARFGVNGVDVGFFCSTPMVALTRNVQRKKAFELLTTGRLMTAEEACEAGLVNEVVPADRLTDATTDLARQIAAKSTAVISLGKKAFYRQAEADTDTAYRLMTEVMVDNLMLRDAEEGFAAFIDKRAPRWDDA